MSAAKIDPILLSVYARTFKSITDEMSISMEQTTRSPILCEAKDYVTGLYDADGNMLEQTENLPILAFSLAPVCKYIKEFFGDEIYPGDVIFGDQEGVVVIPRHLADEIAKDAAGQERFEAALSSSSRRACGCAPRQPLLKSIA